MEEDKAEWAAVEGKAEAEAKGAAAGDKEGRAAAAWAVPWQAGRTGPACVRNAGSASPMNAGCPACSGNAPNAGLRCVENNVFD